MKKIFVFCLSMVFITLTTQTWASTGLVNRETTLSTTSAISVGSDASAFDHDGFWCWRHRHRHHHRWFHRR